MYYKKDYKKINFSIIGLLLFLLLLFLSDYFNWFSLLGFNILNINFDFWGVFFSVFVAIFIFGATYILVNKRQNDIVNNKINILINLMENTYSNCLFWIDILSDNKLYNFLSKVKMSKIKKDIVYANILDNVFENHDIIIELLKDGLVNDNIVNLYVKIKRDFNNYVTNISVNLEFDIDKKKQETELRNQINIGIENLDKLKKEFSNLEV